MNNSLTIFKKNKDEYQRMYESETNIQNKIKLGLDFQNKSKRFLSLSIEIINKAYNTSFSLNKKGEGMSSSFKKIDSIVRRENKEIINDLRKFKVGLNNLNLSLDEKKELEIAIDVVLVYITDYSVEIPYVHN